MTQALVLFTVPKGFGGEIGRRQRNAIGSWLLLEPTPEIVLFGDDPGVAEAAVELGVRHVPAVEKTSAGTPLVRDVFRQGEGIGGASVFAYVNCDILLFQDFADAALRVSSCRDRFLMIGRRTDLDVGEVLDFAGGWDEKLRQRAATHGVLHAESGIDYFVFRPALWPEIPPFAVGRFAWDGWLVWSAHQTRAAVIDATRAVFAVHQNHEYPNPPVPHGEGPWHDEIRANLALAGAEAASFTVRDAGQLLTRDGWIVPALTPRHVLRRVHRLRVRMA